MVLAKAVQAAQMVKRAGEQQAHHARVHIQQQALNRCGLLDAGELKNSDPNEDVARLTGSIL